LLLQLFPAEGEPPEQRISKTIRSNPSLPPVQGGNE
jgi:hypothetical protein